MKTSKPKAPLARIMVAPNGARRDQSVHEAIPLTDDALVLSAIESHKAGADGIHIHIRDDDGLHLLDAGRYRALLARLARELPDFYLQVTSEAAGRYDALSQQDMVRELVPDNVSVALREMVREDADWPKATEFYSWCEDNNVAVQHIVYSPDELKWFLASCADGRIAGDHHLVQLVLGTYDGTEISRPESIQTFVNLIKASGLSIDWGLCAFGKEETACLAETARLGGKARVGFENSLWNADGSLAKDNAERVREVRAAVDAAT